MKTIVVIAKTIAWHRAQANGLYTQSTIDSTLVKVGFIHCASPEQTVATANRKFTGRVEDLLLLQSASSREHQSSLIQKG